MLCVFEGMSVRVNVFDLLSSNSLVILNLQPLFNRYGEQRSQRYCFKQGWWKQATRKRLCCDLNHHIRCWRIYTRNFTNAPTARQSSGGFGLYWTLLPSSHWMHFQRRLGFLLMVPTVFISTSSARLWEGDWEKPSDLLQRYKGHALAWLGNTREEALTAALKKNE